MEGGRSVVTESETLMRLNYILAAQRKAFGYQLAKRQLLIGICEDVLGYMNKEQRVQLARERGCSGMQDGIQRGCLGRRIQMSGLNQRLSRPCRRFQTKL